MTVTNADVARTFEQVAGLLELSHANPFRVQAWRHGAAVVRGLERPVAELVHERGVTALHEHGVGEALGRVLKELVDTGRLGMLERLRAELPPEARLAQLPGLGPELSKRACELLHLETLEDLEVAAHDGSLEAVPGFGRRRVELVQHELASLLHGPRRGARPPAPGGAPSVAELLDVDAEYRSGAEAGTLPTLAPRRFNPSHERWLPVLHATRGVRRYTALFSNTARAHELGTTHDWVVLYWGDDHHERQCTVVTEARGPLKGRRVVRGQEAACRAHYAKRAA